MTRAVVEVVTRFGDTVLDVAHVAADRTYRIGTARDVQAAVPGLTSFPLVDRGIVRLPVGVPVHQHAGVIELQLAGVTLLISRRRLPREPVERPRIHWRPVAFVIGSLLVHLAIWFVAITVEPVEPVVRAPRPRPRHARVLANPEPAPEPKRQRARDEPPPTLATPDSQPPSSARTPRPMQRDGSRTDTVGNFADAARDVAAIVKNARVEERLGALRPEDNFTDDDTYTSGFGGSRRMGSGETIKTAEGYQLMLYDVKLCPKRSCTVRGPVPASFIRAQLHEIMPAIYACYAKHADGPGTITLQFTISGDGSVSQPSGQGLGETGSCVASLLSSIYFKAIGDNDVPDGKQKYTTVRYPLQFN